MTDKCYYKEAKFPTFVSVIRVDISFWTNSSLIKKGNN